MGANYTTSYNQPATCYSHSDCGVSGSSEFCYQYSNSWSSNETEAYCSNCIWCDYCSYGIDGDCGAGCDHTTYYGMNCLEQESSSDSSHYYYNSYDSEYCQQHSDCDASAPFCYHHYSIWGVDIATCESCSECHHCGDGVDDTCGEVCGQTTDGDDCSFAVIKTGLMIVIAVLVPLIGCFFFSFCMWYFCCRQSRQSPPAPPQPNMILVPNCQNSSQFISPEQAHIAAAAQYAVSYGDGEMQPPHANIQMVRPMIVTNQQIMQSNAKPNVAPPAYAYSNDQELKDLYADE